MRKVMLVIEEMHHQVGMEKFLRRLGFDVLSLTRDLLVNDALLRFQPEIVISTVRSKNVDGLKLAQKLRKSVTPPPRMALSYTAGSAPKLSTDDQKVVDALIEIPAAGETAIKLIAQLANLPVEPLLEKYRKFASAKLSTDEETVIVTSKPAAPSTAAVKAAPTSVERLAGYDKFLNEHGADVDPLTIMPRERAAEAMAKLKKISETEKPHLDEIQNEKIKFATALFEEGAKKK